MRSVVIFMYTVVYLRIYGIIYSDLGAYFSVLADVCIFVMELDVFGEGERATERGRDRPPTM